jgi:hypothetical protein
VPLAQVPPDRSSSSSSSSSPPLPRSRDGKSEIGPREEQRGEGDPGDRDFISYGVPGVNSTWSRLEVSVAGDFGWRATGQRGQREQFPNREAVPLISGERLTEAAVADSRWDAAGAGDFIDRGFGIIEGARTPGAKQQAVRKMDGLLTVPPMEPGERSFYLLLALRGPLRRATRALISGILNYVFTCVSLRDKTSKRLPAPFAFAGRRKWSTMPSNGL